MLLKAGFFPYTLVKAKSDNDCNGLYKDVGGLYSSWGLRDDQLQASSMQDIQDIVVTTILPFLPPSVKVGGHKRNFNFHH